MTITRFLAWFQVAALIYLACLGLGRGLVLLFRGVRVVVIYRNRSLVQALFDLLQVMLLLFWTYEILAYAWPFPAKIVPAWLGVTLFNVLVVKFGGALIVVLGLVIYTIALKAFGDSWRLGIDRDSPGLLVTQGVFAWTRNPIYVGLDLFAIGIFLLQGRLIFLALALVTVAMLHDQIRREEYFLARTYGNAYSEYCARVRRYIKWRG